MSIVLMPRASQIDAHDIARAVSRLSVASYIPEGDDDDEEEDEFNEQGGTATGFGDPPASVVMATSDGSQSTAVQLETVLATLQHSNSFKQSARKQSKLKFYFQKFLNLYDRLGLKHVSPILFLILYSLIGAALFCIIEKPMEEEELHKAEVVKDKNREDAIRQLAAILNDSRNSIEMKMWQARDLIIWYENMLAVNDTNLKWDMWGALFYVGTIFTTIGYGNIYCKTPGGRVLTILYAIFGIPLVLAILSDLGMLFCKWINSFWKTLVLLVGTKTKQVQKTVVNKTIGLKKRHNNGDTVHFEDEEPPLSSGGIPVGTLVYQDDSDVVPDRKGASTDNNNGKAMTGNNIGEAIGKAEDKKNDKDKKKSQEENDIADVPVSMAVAVTVLWLLFCSSLFLIWETNWSYFQAVYFFFVSLSTIGLGDIVPTRPRMMVINFGLVIIGLSLVSMTISVIQQNIESFLYRVLKMIQEEYAAAIEAGLLAREDEIVDKVLAKQPWYMRKMAPMVMTQNQKRQLFEIVNFTHTVTVSTGIQCTSVNQVTTSNVTTQANLPVMSEMFTQTDEEEFEELEQALSTANAASGEMSEKEIPEPVVMVDTAVQTAITALQLDAPAVQPDASASVQPEVSAVVVAPSDVATVEPDDVPTPQTPTIVVPSIFLEAENLSPIDISNVTCVSTKDEGVQVTCRSGAGAMTIVEASYATNFVDAIVQTDDSYLKLAKKLEALKVNRAKSLAIWASPVSKRPRPAPVMESTPE